VPVIGLIENMSGEIFGAGGGDEAAQLMGVEFLGSVELDPEIRKGGDSGRPIVIEAPDSPAAQQLRTLARKIAARVSVMMMTPDPELKII
jgi:ATP-binding protein involved in chromosome partitioning